MDKMVYATYVSILKSELIPAMGCTEPIAVALAGAKASQVLGATPDHMDIYCSGNIIKNVKGVVVPNSGGQTGIAAAVLGAVGGDADKGLEVIEGATPEDAQTVRRLLEEGMCACHLAQDEENLYIRVEAARGQDRALAEIRTRHDHFSRIEKNGEVLASSSARDDGAGPVEKSCLNLKDILEFAGQLNIDEVRELLDRQIDYNRAISEEGLKRPWGAQVGRTLFCGGASPLPVRAAAKAAAGSDARMGGCSMPVVINSGSGNQGITVTMPLYEYAVSNGVPMEKLYRALALANLISVHEKRFIGNLSAYCGAVSAATASVAGIAYLEGADYEMIGNTIINSIGTIGGMVCDGAKASCASKIASAVQTAMLAYDMAKNGHVLKDGEGLVEGGVEGTIRNIGRMGREGMRETDVEILNIMLGN